MNEGLPTVFLTYNLFDRWLIEQALSLPIIYCDDPLGKPLVPDEPPPDPQPKRRSRIVCDFCGCELAADGGVLKTSERAKQLERADKEITDLQGRLETKSQEVEDLKAKLDQPKPLNGGAPLEKKEEPKSFIRW